MKLRRRSICSSATTVDDGEAAKVEVRPPPRDYDFRAETSAETRETVRSLHPELMDLVEDGTLVIVKRPAQYVERRSDGYVEPEVVYIVGTVHTSLVSADQVRTLSNLSSLWFFERVIVDVTAFKCAEALRIRRSTFSIIAVVKLESMPLPSHFAQFIVLVAM